MKMLLPLVLALIVGAGYSITASAQDLKDIAARDKIEIQKLTQRVDDAIDASWQSSTSSST